MKTSTTTLITKSNLSEFMKAKTLILPIVSMLFLLSLSAEASSPYTWADGSTSALWTANGAWGQGASFPTLSTDVADFNYASGAVTITGLGGAIGIGQINLQASSGNVTITDATNTLTLNDIGTANPAITLATSGQTLTLNVNTTFKATGGSSSNEASVTLVGGSNLAFGGATTNLTTGNGSLVFSGGGTVTIGSGVTVVGGGSNAGLVVSGTGTTLNLNSNKTSGTFTSNRTSVNAGATLNIGTSYSQKTVLNGGATVGAAAKLYTTVNGGSFSSILYGQGGFNLIGANISGGGTATYGGLNISNSFTGNTTMDFSSASNNTLVFSGPIVGTNSANSPTAGSFVQVSGGGLVQFTSTTGNSYVTSSAVNGTEVGSGLGVSSPVVLQLETTNGVALTGNTQVDSGSTIQLLTASASQDQMTAGTLTINGAGGSNAGGALGSAANGALENVSGNNLFGAAIALAADSTISSDAGTLVLPGQVSGVGFKLTKAGAGTVLLAGSNTYTGATAVTGGTLIVTNASGLGTGAGGVTVSFGKALDYFSATDTQLALASTVGITGGAGTTLGGSIGSTLTSAEINATGQVTTTAGNLTVNLYAVNGAATGATGTYTLINGASGSTFGTPALGTVYNDTDFTVGAFSTTTNALKVAITQTSGLSTAWWMATGGYSTAPTVWAAGNGTTLSNWSAISSPLTVQGLVPGSGTVVNFTTNTNGAMTLGANMTVDSLSLQDTSAHAFTLSADGNALTIAPASSANGINVASGVVTTSTIGADVVLAGNQTWTNNSATSGDLLTLTGNISGSGNLVLNNNGASASKITLSGLTMNESGTITNQGASTGITLINNVIGTNVTGITQNSTTSTLELAGVNTFNGPITITAGTLQLGNGGGNAVLGSGTYSGNILDNGTFFNSTSAAQTISGVISGTGNVTKGQSTLNLTGENTYTGITSIIGGSFLTAGSVENPGVSGPFGKQAANAVGTIVFTGGILQYSAVNNFDYSGRFSTAANQLINIDPEGRTITFATALTSSGGTLTVADFAATTPYGTLNLTAPETYTGATTVSKGTLNLLPGGSLTGSSVTLNNAASNFNESSSSFIAGAGASFTISAGTALLSGSNSYGGGTTVSGGTLIANNTSALGSGTVTLSGTGVLSYEAPSDAQLALSSTMSIATGTTIGGSIGSSGTSSEINAAGVVTATGAVKVNVYGESGTTPGTNTYTLLHGAATSTLSTPTYTLGTVYNNSNFTVALGTSTATDL